jgi:hypothetical protein
MTASPDYDRASTQGCTELTCIYHGRVNMLKRQGLLRWNWEPDDWGADVEYEQAQRAEEDAHL